MWATETMKLLKSASDRYGASVLNHSLQMLLYLHQSRRRKPLYTADIYFVVYV